MNAIRFLRGAPVVLALSNPARGGWVRLSAAGVPFDVEKGDVFRCELTSLAFPVDVPVHSMQDVERYVGYVTAPAGLEVRRGRRLAESPGIVDLELEEYAVELRIPRLPAADLPLTLPVRLCGLNRRWSAGVFQYTGYVKGAYGSGENRYRALGMDGDGNAYLPALVKMPENPTRRGGQRQPKDRSGSLLQGDR
jgi:hypothetical protein